MISSIAALSVMLAWLVWARSGFIVSPKTVGRPAAEVAREQDLVRQINQISDEFSPEIWQRYRELRAKLAAEMLVPDGPEHKELIRMSDQLEIRHADRLGLLIELATLRKTSLLEVMKHSDVVAHFPR